ncbi:hypothetical protein FHS16_002779 [Paenibacillus endophyticus]|uniref:Uncharacterized protein n=1 Tax=Paenibacillus endophyticus TaxID=1294268 RepID=A0A7W5C832_9BACL|nr:hypothetical protein [Paenibacillus endophyticus]MBB3152722.1 hypothetical protein [Paenibacillus endophyticus]
MPNRLLTIPFTKRRRKGLASFAAFGIAVTLLVGCGQTSTRKSGADTDPGAAAIAPVNQAEAKTAPIEGASQGDNPFAAAGIDDPAAFIRMFESAQAAVAADEKVAVAALILLPLQVNGETPYTVTSRDDFIAKYDEIMTKPVKDALAAQKVDELFVRDQGVMVGIGELWFGASAEVPQAYGMIAVNPIPIDRKT